MSDDHMIDTFLVIVLPLMLLTFVMTYLTTHVMQPVFCPSGKQSELACLQKPFWCDLTTLMDQLLFNAFK